MAYIFQTIAKQAQTAKVSLTDGNVADAREWYRNVASRVTQVNINRLQADQPFRLESSINRRSIGRMYSFFYDAKGKDELAYWDRYPLVFPIELYSDGFLGINLHYLPPRLRAALMNKLYDTMTNKKYDETTKLNINYRILKSSTKFKFFEPCIKRYLITHVRSKFMYISPNEWDMAMMLPTERFVGAQKSTVFKESISKVRR